MRTYNIESFLKIELLFQLGQLSLHEIPNEEVEELKTYTDEEFNRNVQNVMRELNSNEAQLKAAGNPNLNILKVTYSFDRNPKITSIKTVFLIPAHYLFIYFTIYGVFSVYVLCLGVQGKACHIHRTKQRAAGRDGKARHYEEHAAGSPHETKRRVHWGLQYHSAETEGDVPHDHSGR